MNAVVKTEQSLIPLEHINAVEIFTGAKLDDLLQQIRAETATIVPDVSTMAGRKEIASLAYKIARSKTTIDDAGKELVSEWKEKSKVVDASRKKARDYLDTLRDEVRKPLTEFEAEEARAKQAAIDKAVANLAAREAAIAEKEAAIAAKEKAEADALAAKEAAKAQAERDERIRKEAAEKAAREAAEAVAKAEADRLAAIEREKAMEAAAVERERIAAEKAAKDQAEAVRHAEERAVQEAARIERQRHEQEVAAKAAQEKREANKRHRAKVNNAVVTDLVKAGCDEAKAKLIVVAIASGRVAHTTIAY